MEEEKIIQTLWAIATADVSDAAQLINGQLELTDTSCWSEALRQAVASVEKTGGNVKIKFYDKLKALELLGKALGLFERQIGKKGENNLLQTILDSTKEVIPTDDISEVQQTAAIGDDLVESAGAVS